MRILVGIHSPAVIGGAQTYLEKLLPSLESRGHSVALIHSAQPTQRHRSLTSLVERTWSVERDSPSRLVTELGDWQPDLFFDNGLNALEHQRVLAHRWQTVVMAHDYVGTCISGLKRFRRPQVQMCTRTLGPGCLLHYLPRGCGGLNPAVALRRYHQQQRSLAYLRRASLLLVASEHMRKEYLAHGFEASRVGTVPLFAPTGIPETIDFARPFANHVLFLSRLTELKGGTHLIRALAQASSALKRTLTLVVAGEGPERERMERTAKELGVPVRFMGWVDDSTKQRLLAATDVIALPSLWPEPFGLVGLEAANFGVPCVAFDVGGVREWLRPGESGELATGRPTVDALGDALVRALESLGHLQRLRKGARELAQGFGLEPHVTQLETWFELSTAAADGRPQR